MAQKCSINLQVFRFGAFAGISAKQRLPLTARQLGARPNPVSLRTPLKNLGPKGLGQPMSRNYELLAERVADGRASSRSTRSARAAMKAEESFKAGMTRNSSIPNR